MLARRLLASTFLLTYRGSIPWDPGEEPLPPIFPPEESLRYGKYTSSRGGFFELYRRASGGDTWLDVRVVDSAPPYSGTAIGFSAPDSYGYIYRGSYDSEFGGPLPAFRTFQTDGTPIAAASFPMVGNTLLLLKSRVVGVRRALTTGPYTVFSKTLDGADGPSHLVDAVMPNSGTDAPFMGLGTIDGETAVFLPPVSIQGGRKILPIGWGAATNIAFQADAAPDPEQPNLAVVVWDGDGDVTEVPFEGSALDTPDFLPHVPAGAGSAPIYARNVRVCFLHVAWQADGGPIAVGLCVAREVRWDGTKTSSGEPSPYSTKCVASLAHKETEFMARINVDGTITILKILSRSSWWYDYSDKVLYNNQNSLIVSKIGGVTNQLHYDDDDFNELGAAWPSMDRIPFGDPSSSAAVRLRRSYRMFHEAYNIWVGWLSCIGQEPDGLVYRTRDTSGGIERYYRFSASHPAHQLDVTRYHYTTGTQAWSTYGIFWAVGAWVWRVELTGSTRWAEAGTIKGNVAVLYPTNVSPSFSGNSLGPGYYYPLI